MFPSKKLLILGFIDGKIYWSISISMVLHPYPWRFFGVYSQHNWSPDTARTQTCRSWVNLPGLGESTRNETSSFAKKSHGRGVHVYPGITRPGKHRNNYGKSPFLIGKPWENHGKTMGNHWETIETIGFIVINGDLSNKNVDFMTLIPSGYLLHSHGIDGP